jgi:uncharacterized protein (DUF2267 family)
MFVSPRRAQACSVRRLLPSPTGKGVGMSATGVSVFEKTIEKTNAWLVHLEKLMNWQDRQQAYVALRAVLHALRDRVPPDEVAQFAAQLPMLIRGFFYEGWHPAHKPLKYRHKQEFLDQVALEAPALEDDELEAVVTAVFLILASELGGGETDQVRATLPAELRELWPRPGL